MRIAPPAAHLRCRQGPPRRRPLDASKWIDAPLGKTSQRLGPTGRQPGVGKAYGVGGCRSLARHGCPSPLGMVPASLLAIPACSPEQALTGGYADCQGANACCLRLRVTPPCQGLRGTRSGVVDLAGRPFQPKAGLRGARATESLRRTTVRTDGYRWRRSRHARQAPRALQRAPGIAASTCLTGG